MFVDAFDYSRQTRQSEFIGLEPQEIDVVVVVVVVRLLLLLYVDAIAVCAYATIFQYYCCYCYVCSCYYCC